MKRTIFLILFALLFASCGENISEEMETGDSTAQVIKGDKTFNFRFDAFSTCNKYCNNIYLHINYREKGDERFSIYFYLKDNGAIDKITYLGDDGVFESSYFDPYNYFKISNFEFDSITGSLYFEFKGNLFSNREPLFLNGKVDIPVLKDIECRNYYANSLTLHDENKRLLSNRGGSIIDNPQTLQKKFRYEFYTDNGFRFTLNSEKNINELPHGSYSFTVKDITNNVMLQKYVGKADVTPSFYHKDWIQYETTGSYAITGQYRRGEYNVTTGSIDIKAFDNDELKYDFEKIYFEAVNIEGITI